MGKSPHNEDFVSINDGALGSMDCGCPEDKDHRVILQEDE